MKKTILKMTACFCLFVSGCGSGELKQISKDTPIYSSTSDYSTQSELRFPIPVQTVFGQELQYLVLCREGNSEEHTARCDLGFIDPESMKLLLVNSSPGNGCSAASPEDCTGSFSGIGLQNFQLYKDSLYYQIHTFRADDDAPIIEIWKADLDGTNRKKLFELDFPKTDATWYDMLFRDDALFCFDQKNSRLMKYDLKKDSLMTAADLSECENISQINQDEDGIYICAERYQDHLNPVLKLGADQSLEVIWDNAFAYYADSEKCLALEDGDLENGRYCLLRKGYEPVVLGTGPHYALVNEDGFILTGWDTEKNITEFSCYDWDGTLLDTVLEQADSYPQIFKQNLLITTNNIYPIVDGRFQDPVSIESLRRESGFTQ